MNSTARLFFKSAILLLIVGLVAGIGMAASHNHTISGAHAHLNLLGFVVSAVYGTYYALDPTRANGRLPILVWGLHTLGTVVMFVALSFVLMGDTALEPIVAIASLSVLIAAVLFGWTVFRPAGVIAARAPMAPAE